MTTRDAAPCRHAGVPPAAIINKVSRIIESLASDERFLASHGVTADEYRSALPMAIESTRGSASASSGSKRRFLISIFDLMKEKNILTDYEVPIYGDDTIYRLKISDETEIAVIQKGCPDGVHSSERWSRPEWATEVYLWWLCSSLANEPGEHITKGVGRLRKRFFRNDGKELDGVIFHNEMCGSAYRPCPKMAKSITIDDKKIPPPCIYVFPNSATATEDWKWIGKNQKIFPRALLNLFSIKGEECPAYVGNVGFQKRADEIRTTITSRFGNGRSSTFRS